ncbi:uncharacterized protein EAF02_001776 [Botrytis sinoallii]|uniref:uncharacterized protein n=1 Tax=Botrytis sinoallii TaxID=1463999 RepID=UPI0019008C0B|nr:uncharacterized protein EAF02_001776 [Botrytis sinoallii]KAF7891451.1 hypothetical protein EAF02_001776 [Botrytis sinoallii]
MQGSIKRIHSKSALRILPSLWVRSVDTPLARKNTQLFVREYPSSLDRTFCRQFKRDSSRIAVIAIVCYTRSRDLRVATLYSSSIDMICQAV